MRRTQVKALENIICVLKDHKKELAEQYRVSEIGIFGSYVRGKQHKKSDVDILVDFYETPSLLQFIHLENYLTDLLGINVDLVMKKALRKYIGQEILKEVIFLRNAGLSTSLRISLMNVPTLWSVPEE